MTGPASSWGRGARARAAAAAVVLAAVAALLSGALAATTPTPAAPTAAKPAAAKPARSGATRAARAPAAAPASAKKPLDQAADARGLEELGAYARAAATLRALRGRVPPDADLELALALDEARSGQIDSAAARLASPLLAAALVDSLPAAKRHLYVYQREGLWVNGKFDGWNWYVARARAEIAARQGRWADALADARVAVAARPEAGKEWLVLAVSAGRAGQLEEAARAADRAAWLDPSLPEAQYVNGLYAWRAGRRHEAEDDFRAAVALDSSYREPAIALVRSRLPGIAPDSLPVELLTGVRATGLLTSPLRPKPEEFVQSDAPANIVEQEILPLPDSLKARFPKAKMIMTILIDERGRAVLHELPYSSQSLFPEPLVRLVLGSVPKWRYHPAIKFGQARRTWANIQLDLTP